MINEEMNAAEKQFYKLPAYVKALITIATLVSAGGGGWKLAENHYATKTELKMVEDYSRLTDDDIKNSQIRAVDQLINERNLHLSLIREDVVEINESLRDIDKKVNGIYNAMKLRENAQLKTGGRDVN